MVSTNAGVESRLRRARLWGGLLIAGSLAAAGFLFVQAVRELQWRGRATFVEAAVVTDEPWERSPAFRRSRVHFDARDATVIRKGRSPLGPGDHLRVCFDPNSPQDVHVDQPQWMLRVLMVSICLLNAAYWAYLVRRQTRLVRQSADAARSAG